ncbi:hypothetical protein C8F01DRAFT_3903 [Mycena amicta]|nr:hypothetical protein C8F01DRAFT_3903 [Mycena amicta]
MNAALGSARVRLSEIEGEIRRFEAQLAILRSERTEIRQRLDEYTYPVLTLPNEITTEIFVHYLPPYPDHPPLAGLGSPTHLLGICRLWRSIALHSPELWRAIELDFGEGRPDSVLVEVAKAWLHRSGSSPLSLRVDFSTVPVGPPEDSLLQAVIAHRSRWEHVDLRVPPAELSLISGPSPRLVRFTLTTTWGQTVPIISLQNAHLLRSVSLWNVAHNPGTSTLPWDQLTSLSLRNTTLVDCAPILPMAVNLLRCKLFFHGTAEGIRVQVPRLEVFSLITRSDDDDLRTTGIDAFTLPSLRKLEVGILGVDAVEQLQSLISRSECRLERLRIVSRPSEHAGDLVALACHIAFPLADVDVIDYWRFSDTFNWKAPVEREEYWDLVTDSSVNGASSEEYSY